MLVTIQNVVDPTVLDSLPKHCIDVYIFSHDFFFSVNGTNVPQGTCTELNHKEYEIKVILIHLVKELNLNAPCCTVSQIKLEWEDDC